MLTATWTIPAHGVAFATNPLRLFKLRYDELSRDATGGQRTRSSAAPADEQPLGGRRQPQQRSRRIRQIKSRLGHMIDLAAHIDVPPTDVAEGRVYRPQRTAEQERMFAPMISVRTGTTPPEDPRVVAIRYRDQ